ncbi:MAG: TlpA family protein disulfide reductase [Alphaproteobacteria bacterium]|nr:TlpA family protein disulfide reductase [Alphaproteobacteria bacterium]MCB9792994.1 TlpA family protein disulfide reductase [Alphaproteobacteria bacterium]
MTILLLALLACGKDDPVDSNVDSNVDDSAGDSADVERYGPENRWYHAPVTEVPEAPDGDVARVGRQLPELDMVDQYGDSVSLYQFAGRLVVLDIAAIWCGPCHNFAPFLEDFAQAQGEDGAIVITVVVQDVNFNPARAENVAEWVEAHETSGPVVFLADPAQRTLIDEAAEGYPSLMVVDPEMRLVTNQANNLPTNWWQQVLDYVGMGVGGNLDDEEVCGDGVDNDLDFAADCMLESCHSDASCAQAEQTGELGPCAPAHQGGVADVYRAEVQGAVAELVVDTVAADTVFEPVLYVKLPEQSWADSWVIGDDEMDCSYPAEDYGCAVGWLRPGTYDIAIGAGSGGDEQDGDCVDPSRGAYALRVRGDVTLTLDGDDVEIF